MPLRRSIVDNIYFYLSLQESTTRCRPRISKAYRWELLPGVGFSVVNPPTVARKSKPSKWQRNPPSIERDDIRFRSFYFLINLVLSAIFIASFLLQLWRRLALRPTQAECPVRLAAVSQFCLLPFIIRRQRVGERPF